MPSLGTHLRPSPSREHFVSRSPLKFVTCNVTCTMPRPKQLTPFEIGQIKAHMHHELEATEIARIIGKGLKNKFSHTAVRNAMVKLKENPKWRGERAAGSGAKRKTTAAQDKLIVVSIHQPKTES